MIEQEEDLFWTATKIAVGIERDTVSEKSDGTSWNVGKLRVTVPGIIATGSVVLYRPDPDEINNKYDDPTNVLVVSASTIIIKDVMDFEEMNDYMSKSALRLNYKKYIKGR